MNPDENGNDDSDLVYNDSDSRIEDYIEEIYSTEKEKEG